MPAPRRDLAPLVAIVFSSLVLPVSLAGCGPLPPRSIGWALVGFDLWRMASRSGEGPDGPVGNGGVVSALGEAMERSRQEEARTHARWVATATRRYLQPFLDGIAALEPIDTERFERLWKIDLVVRDAPAGDLLRDLADRMDLRLEDRLVPRGVLTRRVSLGLRGVSRLEALDAVCAAVGIHADVASPLAVGPEYARGPWRFDEVASRSLWEAVSLRPYQAFITPFELMGFPSDEPLEPGMLLEPPRRPMIVLEPGPWSGQRLALGPFSVSIDRPIEFPGDMSGAVDILASFAGAPTDLRHVWEMARGADRARAFADRMPCGIEIAVEEGGHVEGKGVDANDGRLDSGMGMFAQAGSRHLKLVRLDRDVREVTLAGRVVAWLPGAVEKIRIDAPATGARRVEGRAATVSVGERSVSPDVTDSPAENRLVEIPLEVELPEDGAVWVVELDTVGKPRAFVELHAPAGAKDEDSAETPGRMVLRRLLRFEREPAAIQLTLVHDCTPLERRFEATLPLRCHALQPDGPRPLEIDGERPLDLVATPDAEGTTVFRLSNHSNKGVVRVAYSLVDFWIDKEKGTVISRRDFEKISGFEPGEAVIVPAGGTVDMTDIIADFFYRPNPAGDFPTLRVDRVEFADGTVWVDPDHPAPVP